MRQNNTCVLKQKSIEKYSANNTTTNVRPVRSGINTLGELNNWARHVQPATTLNTWCVDKDNTGGDLAEGQFCQANCAGIGNNKTGWYPGGKIKKAGSGLQWEKEGIWYDFNPTHIAKNTYCKEANTL
jgi:hypothetical protein